MPAIGPKAWAKHPKSVPGVPYMFPDWLDRVQMRVQSPLIKRFGIPPGFAVIEHRGRKSGRAYTTVVRGYAKHDRFSVMLGHGKADWVRNMLAAGEADVRMFRRDLHVADPRIIPVGGDTSGLPLLVRGAGRLVAILVADVTESSPRR